MPAKMVWWCGVEGVRRMGVVGSMVGGMVILCCRVVGRGLILVWGGGCAVGVG